MFVVEKDGMPKCLGHSNRNNTNEESVLAKCKKLYLPEFL